MRGGQRGARSENRFSRLAPKMAGLVLKADYPAEQHIHSCTAAHGIISHRKGEAN